MSDDMQVDSDNVMEYSNASFIESVNECFASQEAYDRCSSEAKAQTLALLGSIDFRLEDLEKEVLNGVIIPQVFKAMQSFEHDPILAEEAAGCLKNLMTNEHLGGKCTRRLYALCIFPVLSKVMERLVSDDASVTSLAPSSAYLESVAVMILCIASNIPASLNQINASPLSTLLFQQLQVSLERPEDIQANNALLQAFLVAMEDNAVLTNSLINLKPLLLIPSPETSFLSLSHQNFVLRLMCFLQAIQLKPELGDHLNFSETISSLLGFIQCPLPDGSLMATDAFSVKIFFETIELVVEALELMFVQGSKKLKSALQGANLMALRQYPFALSAFWIENFKAHFGEEGNADRLRLVQRIFSIVGTLFTCQEQLLTAGCIKWSSGQVGEFVALMEGILKLVQEAPSEELSIEDEASGLLRALLIAWDSDYPSMSNEILEAFMRSFFKSSSPVVLTNVCAMVAMLIPYAAECIQKEFCVFLNSLLCTDPFDTDHLEILMSAVDAITGIFDPESKEWPAKPLSEFKEDVRTAREALLRKSNFDEFMKQAAKDRARDLSILHQIL